MDFRSWKGFQEFGTARSPSFTGAMQLNAESNSCSWVGTSGTGGTGGTAFSKLLQNPRSWHPRWSCGRCWVTNSCSWAHSVAYHLHIATITTITTKSLLPIPFPLLPLLQYYRELIITINVLTIKIYTFTTITTISSFTTILFTTTTTTYTTSIPLLQYQKND